MKITLRNSVRPSISITHELDVDMRHGLAFMRVLEAQAACRALFGESMGHGLSGIEAKDEDGRDYLVLLR